jgi:UDP-N-acetylglucosamine/UDP-N-acetylgalactosamine diphosphorylase
MLNQRPIFLGGQGGLVGPCRLEYGTTIAAGTIYRRDELRPGRLIFGGEGKGGNIAYTPGRHRTDKRIIKNNIIYIANLFALMQWYRHVRSLFVSGDFPQALFEAVKEKLNMAIQERINRLGDYCLKISTDDTADKSASDPRLTSKKELPKRWPETQDYLNARQNYEGDTNLRDTFLEKLNPAIKNSGKIYIATITGLPPADTQSGTNWLQGIVDEITTGALELLA